MQEPKFGGFDRDLGLELLMNPKKKVGSDAVSMSSRSSVGFEDEAVSVRRVSLKPNVINVADHLREVDEDDEDEFTEENASYDDEEDDVPQMFVPSRNQKVRVNMHNHRNEESSSKDGESQIESLGIGSIMHEQRRRLSEEDIILMKKELLYQFERLEKKGMKLPKKFTLASSLEEMRMEYERLKRDKDIDSSVKLQRRIMMATVSGVEWLNGKFDPIGASLDGWSDSIYENINDYDDVFEELHDKYKGKAKIAPELKIMMMLGGSAFMHHMTHSMFKTQLPGLDEILRSNPELAKNLAAATSQHMAHQQKSAGNLFGSLGNMFSGFFGGGNNANSGPSPAAMAQSSPNVQPTTVRVNMKGPSNVEDILREFDNDRIEMMSAITESELAELTADDTSSINGLLMGSSKRRNKKGKGISLDI